MKENYSDKGKIELSFDEIMRVFMVLEKMLQPLHRSEWCEEIDLRR